MNDLHGWITQQVDCVEQLIGENEWPPSQSKGVRLRCEADRRILNRHRLATEWTWEHNAPCHGCGTSGYDDTPNTDNLNDCPELLDLAHAHGITEEILAGLDQPLTVRQEPKPRGPLPDTRRVPAALRGPDWSSQ
ncbi:hypothetical protein [Streptomyces antibioticus]|uniref:Uncharacterized protein n=1 Tax=Streptomyces antibioticus TaxID=1890 RepID=A0AAE7CNE6_STRAT|nr:hypothetical protein [Streptomyces antibioticus]OOQ47337.1 hypothetical protein AFM16_31860 [Streptomyces antibioticus]QIT47660.1 hypothetical protein HCX60_32415 [Streptomyces antibioticus]